MALSPELRQDLITKIVTAWEFKNPEAMRNAYKMVKLTRSTRANVFASDGTKDDMDLRLMLRLPQGLWKMFAQLLIDPAPFHEASELKWFMKNYKQYVVPEKL